MNRVAAIWLVWALLAVASPLQGEDWPTFRHDIQRSGRSAELLAAPELRLAWTWQSPQPPQPAWDGAARWDAYAGIRGLRSMRTYDLVFHPIAAQSAVYFGSSTDDCVYALDAKTGKPRWVFTTDGPVRIAPTLADGRLYFGSDDGYIYCLDAERGSLLWKYSPSRPERKLVHNSRFISRWPCRTGVLVDGSTAYMGAGMLPWDPTYLCAVDAVTGKPEGNGRYVRELSGMTMEGALLASAGHLYSPQGRVPPWIFDRTGGQPWVQLEGGGGSFMLLTDDGRVLHGPGNKTGWIADSDPKNPKKPATLNGANEAIVAGPTVYVLTDNQLKALDRASGNSLWSCPSDCPYALILAGQTLILGGRDRVVAIAAQDGKTLWEGCVAGKAYGLAVANGGLLVSTDEGGVYCFRPGASGIGIPARKTGSNEKFQAKAAEEHLPRPAIVPREKRRPAETAILAAGPYLQFTGPDSAVVRWQTQEPSGTWFAYEGTGQVHRLDEPTPKTAHEVMLKGLRKDWTYLYEIQVDVQGKRLATDSFECDTFFNYSVAAVPDSPGTPVGDERSNGWVEIVDRALASAACPRGICLVVGSGDGRLILEIARRSRMQVLSVDTQSDRVAAVRQILQRSGIYGARATVLQVDRYDALPLVSRCADLIVCGEPWSANQWPVAAAEVARMLRPDGGTAVLRLSSRGAESVSRDTVLGWLKATLAGVDLQPHSDSSTTLHAGSLDGTLHHDAGGLWLTLRRRPLEGAGVWSHQYGLADNSAFGGESLGGARAAGQLAVQWIGRPGPRAQADRNGRKPSPLAIGGRLYMQGLHRVIALNAFNGTILWSLEIPPLERFNIPRDSSNWCAAMTPVRDASQVNLFLAIRNKCWRVDGTSGRVEHLYDVVPGETSQQAYDWGYVACPDGKALLGSAVRSGTAWTNFWGRADAGWYDAKRGRVTDKICSDHLFAIELAAGQTRWTYRGGLVLNPTITVAGDRVYFVECRHPEVLQSDSRRVGMPQLWQEQYLVALDLATGAKVWAQPIKVEEGTVVFYLAAQGDKLVFVSSGQRYHVYAFQKTDGKPAWDAAFDWPGDNHGKHMSRPAIVGNNVFVRPRVLDLATGQLRDFPMPEGGCGTYALTRDAVLFRAGDLTLWDVVGKRTTGWSRLRPDCWLSALPACGMILAPEAGGGCSCGNWLETSIGLIPLDAGAK